VIGNAMKRAILWEYPRESWQYNVFVGIILLFIFLTPRSWFRDQPRAPHASPVVQLGAGHGDSVFWIEPELLAGVPVDQRLQKLGAILKRRTGKTQSITRVEPIFDAEQEVKGYMAFAKP
jgi:hypothetical protein